MLPQALIDVPTTLIKQFATKGVSFAAAYLILIAVLVCWALILAKHRRFIMMVRDAAWTVDSVLRRSDASSALVNADIVLLQGTFGSVWKPYRATIESDPWQEGGYRNLVDPREWFAVERLPGRGYETWAGTLAGVSLTIGLLFTFVGLAAALLQVGDVGGADVDLRAATGKILEASSAKFITSIAGLIAYIASTIGARLLVAQQHDTVRRLVSVIQRLTTPLQPEGILLALARHQQTQIETLRQLPAEIAGASDAQTAGRLDTLTVAIEGAGRSVTQSIAVMGAGIGRINEEAIARMVSQLGSDIRGAVGLEMRAVTSALREAAEELTEARMGLAAAGAAIATEFSTVSAAARSTADTAESALAAWVRRVDEAGARTAAVLEHAAVTAAKAMAEGGAMGGARLSGSAEALADTMAVRSAAIEQALARYERGLTFLQEALAAHVRQAELAGAAMAEASSEMARTTKALRAGAKPIAAALVGIEAVVRSSERALEGHSRRFGEAEGALSHVLAELRDSLRHNPDVPDGAEFSTVQAE